MNNFHKKLIWRIKLILKSLIPIFLALLFEPTKHPWEYIINFIFLGSEKRYKKSIYYLNKYFTITSINDDKLIDFNEIKILINSYFYENQNILVGILILYFDLIYAKKVKHPIPIIIGEGPYELKGCVLKKDDVVIDAGANIGFFSFLASKKVGINGKVYSFEPIFEVSSIIEKSKTYNANSFIINIINMALGRETNELKFDFSLKNFGGSTKNNYGNRIVKQITIDKFIENNSLDKIDFIKMDIEGMEVEAIEGAIKTIKKFKPKLSLCTYHNKGDLQKLINLVLSIRKDYKFYHTDYKLYAW